MLIILESTDAGYVVETRVVRAKPALTKLMNPNTQIQSWGSVGAHHSLVSFWRASLKSLSCLNQASR